MPDPSPDDDELLDAADPAARDGLLARYRGRLRRMVAIRLDPRVAVRVDPSDVVQEVLAAAARGLDAYLVDRPLPFYPWLRQFAANRLADLYRQHVRATRRTVDREERPTLSDHSAGELADRILARGPCPRELAMRAERRSRVFAALRALSEPDREVLTLRYLEELSAGEVGAILGVTEGAAKKRVLRALERLRVILGPQSGDR